MNAAVNQISQKILALNCTMDNIHFAIKCSKQVQFRSIVFTIGAVNSEKARVEPADGSLTWSNVLSSWYFYAPESLDTSPVLGASARFREPVYELEVSALRWPSQDPLEPGVVEEVILGCERYPGDSVNGKTSFKTYRFGGRN